MPLQFWQVPIVLTFSAGPNAALLTLPDVGLFTADADCEIVYAAERHETLGTDAGSVSLAIKKASSGTSISGGTNLLAASQEFNLKAAINTTQVRSKSAGNLAADRVILAGQCVGLDFVGVMTAVTGVSVTVVLRRLREPAY